MKSYVLRNQLIIWVKMITMNIYSSLYHDLDDHEATDRSFNLPHFVGFIMYDLLHSEQSIELITKSSSDCRIIRENPPLFMFFSVPKSYNLRNINLITVETKTFLRLEVIRWNSPLCGYFILWGPTFWGINISFWCKTSTIKI